MDMKKQAKMDVLKHIRKIASDAMKDDLKHMGLKKVSVAADSTKGLEEGLEKAKELIENPEEMMGMESEDSEEMNQDEMDEAIEDSMESEDDIENQIRALQEKKAKLMKK